VRKVIEFSEKNARLVTPEKSLAIYNEKSSFKINVCNE